MDIYFHLIPWSFSDLVFPREYVTPWLLFFSGVMVSFVFVNFDGKKVFCYGSSTPSRYSWFTGCWVLKTHANYNQKSSGLDMRMSPVKASAVPLTGVVMTNQCHHHWSLVLYHCNEECNSLFQQIDKIYSPLTVLKLVMLL